MSRSPKSRLENDSNDSLTVSGGSQTGDRVKSRPSRVMWPSEMRTAHSDAPLGVRSHNGTSAIVHGMVLSIILFCTSVYAIHYSGIHVLNLRILESVFHPHQEILPSTKPNHFASSSAKLIPRVLTRRASFPTTCNSMSFPLNERVRLGLRRTRLNSPNPHN